MEWILIAMIAPILWGLTNYIDKLLLRRHIASTQDVVTLLVFSTITSLFAVLPITFILSPDIFAFPRTTILTLVSVGILGALAVWLYLLALDQDDVSTVVALFQTIPVFGILFSYILLGEMLTLTQLVACVLIIFGSLFISVDISDVRHLRIKHRTLLFMLSSSALFALFETMFKFAALDAPFATSIFWEHVGLVLVGVVLLSFESVRRRFIAVFTTGGAKVVGANLTGELLTICGNVLTNFALLLAPVALVLTVTGMQPMFVFLLGILFTVFAPKYVQESLTPRVLMHKFCAIALILVGVVVLY